MTVINMLQAKHNLSRLVEAIENGTEREIIITRNERPAARLVPVSTCPTGMRIGVARGQFDVSDDIDAHNTEVACLFPGSHPA